MALCYCYIISVLLIFSSAQVKFSAEGRRPAAKGEGEGMVMSSMIGSRPPRCERRCISCGHCEAIQVPVAPQKVEHFSNVINSRSEDTSNYKPMNWKCKCGSRILNP
ncbi:uncharacterized protein A4U43_C03F7420 [Asparagus officinalis]|uniref:Epidermal patterning factor-like protein n=1 Tax=Asparagus officinalis TaxID=4686 RepID=A0A5P1FDC7_ASPOF|nr:EPIDERMAL PATTERNING FACTOR-like protein 2 [Asparagus officinalis]ONK74540.1 uncharacterized protein A4U43_C03F7420 [Asparagus officinalis]